MRRSVLTVTLLLLSLPVFGQSETGYHNANAPRENLDPWHFAIHGFDPVAYFDYGEAVPGRPEFTVNIDGVKFLFDSKLTMKKFSGNPDKYRPAYGGWCAYGLGMKPDEAGELKPGKYPVDPKTFKIIDGQLYLFRKEGTFNALELWNQDEDGCRKRADEVWRAMHGDQE